MYKRNSDQAQLDQEEEDEKQQKQKRAKLEIQLPSAFWFVLVFFFFFFSFFSHSGFCECSLLLEFLLSDLVDVILEYVDQSSNWLSEAEVLFTEYRTNSHSDAVGMIANSQSSSSNKPTLTAVNSLLFERTSWQGIYFQTQQLRHDYSQIFFSRVVINHLFSPKTDCTKQRKLIKNVLHDLSEMKVTTLEIRNVDEMELYCFVDILSTITPFLKHFYFSVSSVNPHPSSTVTHAPICRRLSALRLQRYGFGRHTEFLFPLSLSLPRLCSVDVREALQPFSFLLFPLPEKWMRVDLSTFRETPWSRLFILPLLAKTRILVIHDAHLDRDSRRLKAKHLLPAPPFSLDSTSTFGCHVYVEGTLEHLPTFQRQLVFLKQLQDKNALILFFF
jgi:hypothetical protein